MNICAVHQYINISIRRRELEGHKVYCGGAVEFLASLAGFEPATRCLEGSRSVQLSYRDALRKYIHKCSNAFFGGQGIRSALMACA